MVSVFLRLSIILSTRRRTVAPATKQNISEIGRLYKINAQNIVVISLNFHSTKFPGKHFFGFKKTHFKRSFHLGGIFFFHQSRKIKNAVVYFICKRNVISIEIYTKKFSKLELHLTYSSHQIKYFLLHCIVQFNHI